MEAKTWQETIVHADGCTTNLGIIGAICNCGAEKQAEISWKAGYDLGYDNAIMKDAEPWRDGYQSGMQKVVGFIRGRYLVEPIEGEYPPVIIIPEIDKEWQKFLKDEGLEVLDGR